MKDWFNQNRPSSLPQPPDSFGILVGKSGAARFRQVAELDTGGMVYWEEVILDDDPSVKQLEYTNAAEANAACTPEFVDQLYAAGVVLLVTRLRIEDGAINMMAFWLRVAPGSTVPEESQYVIYTEAWARIPPGEANDSGLRDATPDNGDHADGTITPPGNATGAGQTPGPITPVEFSRN